MERNALVALDKRHVWHPYTPMRRYIDEVDPFVVERAQGARLHDADGRSYIDANASWWVSALGHNHPRLVRALAEQAARLCHTSLAGVTHEPAVRLAEALVQRAPNHTRVFFSDDGSTALEAAIKMAIGFHRNHGRTRKSRFVSLEGAFHGETLGVTALGGVELFRQSFAGVLMDVFFVPVPSPDGLTESDALERLAQLLERQHDEIAAMVVEPIVQGAAGMRIHSPSYLARVRALCEAHDVLLIVDEVMTGYGRTGPFWAMDHTRVQGDIICTAKAFSGGMLPMAATLATERVFQAFLGAPERAFWYGHSFCGNPLGAAVALEVLAVYDEERVIEGVAERADRIRACFDRMGAIPGTRAPRSIGMVGAIDLAPSASYLGDAGWRAHAEARRLGAYLRPLGDVIYVTPAINIPIADLDELLSIVEKSVAFALRA